jgi:hypothetical protein
MKRLGLKSSLRHKLTVLLLCTSLLLLAKPSEAQIGGISGPIGISKGQATGIIVGIVAVGVAIGIGIYLIVRKGPSLTGCAASNAGGLSLQNEGDQQTYTLIGETAGIKTGDRIRVSGKKKKKDPSGNRDFFVQKLAKNYGPCKALPATP